MALVKGKGEQTSTVNVVAEGGDQYLRLLRDGSLLNMPWLMAKAIQGKVFGCNVGVLTTPATLNATIADGEQDLQINVPTGTTLIPVYLSVCFEDTGTAQVLDVLAVASPTSDLAVTGTAITIRNLRTDNPAGSNCTAYSVITGNGTSCESGNYFEFWRPYAGFGEDAFNGSTAPTNNMVAGAKWHIGETVVPPIIVGAGSLNVFASAQAGTGFITAIWVEEPSANLI